LSDSGFEIDLAIVGVGNDLLLGFSGVIWFRLWRANWFCANKFPRQASRKGASTGPKNIKPFLYPGTQETGSGEIFLFETRSDHEQKDPGGNTVTAAISAAQLVYPPTRGINDEKTRRQGPAKSGKNPRINESRSPMPRSRVLRC
jgi:hypothetical protein